MPFCTACGAKNADGLKFCTSCGTPLGGSIGRAQVAPAPPEPAIVPVPAQMPGMPMQPATEPALVQQGSMGTVGNVPLPAGCDFHAFLTHSWVKDEKGRDTHARVSNINDYLKSRGMITWFDGDRMEGQVVDQMINGIDKSAVIVCFVTTAYLKKVGSDNMADNCKKEFSYASRKKTASKMIPVPMEPACLNPNAWEGPVGMELGGLLYKAAFPEDDEDFEQQARNLYDEIVRIAGVQPNSAGGSAHPHRAAQRSHGEERATLPMGESVEHLYPSASIDE